MGQHVTHHSPLTTHHSSPLPVFESVHLWPQPVIPGRFESLTSMQKIRVEREIGGRTLSIETGSIAKLTAGSVIVQYGETVVHAAVARANPREGIDFFPLQVEYKERRSAAGKFPGGFMKREGRPTNKEILTMRLVD